ncbi:MAG: hypothetical protein ACI4J1_00530 [Ruminiclostridium sp.]
MNHFDSNLDGKTSLTEWVVGFESMNNTSGNSANSFDNHSASGGLKKENFLSKAEFEERKKTNEKTRKFLYGAFVFITVCFSFFAFWCCPVFFITVMIIGQISVAVLLSGLKKAAEKDKELYLKTGALEEEKTS